MIRIRRFGTIMADPPWSFRAWGRDGDGRSAERHYPTMALDDIRGLASFVERCTATDAALGLWTTWQNLPDALAVMAAWGFTYRSNLFVWAKPTKDSPTDIANLSDVRWRFGQGYGTRKITEVCLLGTRGKPTRLSKGVPDLIVAPRTVHSEKPLEAYLRLERLFPGPRLDLFARRRVSGWWAWGDELGPRILPPPQIAGAADAIRA